VEEPEDGGQRTAPSYLYSSLLGVQDSELVLAEVEVINIQLDRELSSNACPGEESGDDDVASKQKEEEERRWKDEEEQQQREEEREREENRRKEEQEKQQMDEEVHRQREEEAKQVEAKRVVEAQVRQEEDEGKKGKGKKWKVPTPSTIQGASTEFDELESDDGPETLKHRKTAKTNKESPAKNTRSSVCNRRPAKKLCGSL